MRDDFRKSAWIFFAGKRGLLLVLGAWALLGLNAPSARAQLVPRGAVWKYLDDGSDQGVAWRNPGFDDSLWSSGNAQLGYGDGDEATVVGFGPDPDNKFVTTYFRHSFEVTNPGRHELLALGLQRDDGAVVYLNGVEVARTSLPPGVIRFETFASSTAAGDEEEIFYPFFFDPSPLVAGTNVLAVEIHQRSRGSSDISFDLLLREAPEQILLRGPYLQRGTSTEMIVRWRSLRETDSRVSYGTSPGQLDQHVDVPSPSTNHEVLLSGLTPDTLYYYSVGSSSSVFAGGDIDHFFRTAPPVGSSLPFRAWILGDSGTANGNARAVRDAYSAFAGNIHTDLWLMLGDNAYGDGTDLEYQVAVFDMYPAMLRTSALWSTRGNHEVFPNVYYGMFSLPTQGEAGGLPSSSEAYYSFDFGNVHFVCLDSEGTDRSPTGAMAQWLQADLASTAQRWTVAFWHHPPYTRGSHNSDSAGDSGGRMRDMRQNLLPILEAGGVDLVLSGHSHSYERSFLIGGHYGISTSFGAENLFDGGDGREGGNGAYRNSAAPHTGSVYVVAGSSGRISGGLLNHPVMFTSQNRLGSVVLDVAGDRMDVQFLDSGGAIADSFTLLTEDPVPPSISAVNPDTAPTRGGTQVTISGTRFLPNAEVRFGDVVLDPVSIAETEIVVVSPSGSLVGESVDVIVTQGTGQGVRISGFTYGENPVEVVVQGNAQVGGNLTFTVYGPAQKPVALALGTPGTTEQNGMTFCAEAPFLFVENFNQGINTGPAGAVEVTWENLPGPTFQTWNLIGVIRREAGILENLGCTAVTIFP